MTYQIKDITIATNQIYPAPEYVLLRIYEQCTNWTVICACFLSVPELEKIHVQCTKWTVIVNIVIVIRRSVTWTLVVETLDFFKERRGAGRGGEDLARGGGSDQWDGACKWDGPC